MKSKKIIPLVLAAAVLFTSAAGCSSKSSPKESQPTTIASSVSATGDREMVGNMYKTGLPIAKEKVTLKMLASKRPINGNFEDMVFLKNLEEKTNVKVEFEAVPQAQYNDKKNLILASNDLPDAFFGPAAFSASDIVNYAPQGLIIPLDPQLSTLMPKYATILETYPDFKKFVTAPDGHIYTAARALQDSGRFCPENLFIYEPWLDKLGLKIPDTMDEFYTVLKAFKEQDPNGNGKADEIPFTCMFNDINYGMASLFAMFEIINFPGSFVMVREGNVVFVADKPEYKQAIQYFNKMFSEGLFDSEIFTQDSKQRNAKGQATDVILGAYVAWNDFDVVGQERMKDYVTVPPMKGINGQRLWRKDPVGGFWNTGFVITNSNKNPDITMRWVDEFYDSITKCEAQYGPVDVNLKLKADNTLEFLPTPEGMTYDEFRFKNTPADCPGTIFADEYGKLIPLPDNAVKKAKDVEENYLPYAKLENYPALMQSPAAAEKLKLISTDLINYITDQQSKWMLNGGIDTEWDSYLNKLKQLKSDEYLNIMQSELDRYNSAN